jgi:transposase InsO family protein
MPVPHMMELARGETKELSAKAKFRLEVFDYYYLKSARFSLTGLPDASLTCRHFGIHRSYFYRWKTRYDKHRLSSLENKPTVPEKQRTPSYSRELVSNVRNIREQDPTYSGKKIRPILMRELSAVPSVSTRGRLISRENLFFRSDVKRHKKHSKAAKKAHERTRKPHNLAASGPGQIIEFDMKHSYLLGQKQYAFCAVDLFNREALIHIASSPSSLNAKAALKKVVERFGTGVSIVNDNGSENRAQAEDYLASLNITQYWARPYTPKDKPFVERLIGRLQRECLDYNYAPMNCGELAAVVDLWLDTYHFYRPHQSLDFLTPAEFSAKLGISIPHRTGVSYR